MTVEGKPLFGVLVHGYQPPRRFDAEETIGGAPYRAGFEVAPAVNDQITEQVYQPLLAEVDRLPPGLITSIYAPLRSYFKRNNPELFRKMQEAVANTPNKEYAVLGDPLVHVILPLLPSEDQAMLIEAGKIAFERDFGFFPKGLWLPETAVSHEVIRNAADAGYEFIPLRDSQVDHIPEGVQLDAEHNVCFVKTGQGEQEIAVVLGNSGLSGFVSYAPWSTYNAEGFMEGRQKMEKENGWNALMMMDLERFGHHQQGAEQFLKRILAIQEQYGFAPLDMKTVLESFKTQGGKTYVEVIDKTSWSCPHSLGRWTGNCSCDNPSPAAVAMKQEYFTRLSEVNIQINGALDALDPGWRGEFTGLFANLSDDIFTGVNFSPALFTYVLSQEGSVKKARLYLAKIETMVGMTSCGWFFGDDNRVERTIPANMIQGVQELLQEPPS